MGRTFGTQQVVVIHEGVRNELEAQVQASKAYFNIDAPVYEGDTMELSDPRGGNRTVHITEVKLNQTGGQMGADLAHIAASYSDKAPRAVERAQHVHGDQIIINSSHDVNIATRGGTASQTSAVTAGYEELAQKIKQALDLIDATPDLDEDEREVGRDAASLVLEEIVQPEPSARKLKGALAALRGVIGAAASAGAGAAASGLVGQLFLS